MRITTALVFAALVCGTTDIAYAQDDGVLDLNAEYQSAVRRAQRGDVDGALRRFQTVAQADPYWGDAFYNVGSLSEHAGHFQDCALYFRRYLVLEPEDPDRDDIERSIQRCEEAMPAGGTLHVTGTTPEGVRVVLDGMPMSEGSMGPLRLTPGDYTLTAEVADYHPYTRVVTVADGETTELTIELVAVPLYGSVRLDVVQEGARVLLDGQEIGVTPLAEPLTLEVGDYHLEILKDGYHPWRRNIDVLRDLEDTIDVRLIDESIDLSRYGQ